MKSNKVIFAIALTILMVGSCKQEVITLKDPEGPPPPPPPSEGTADFTKFIAIGNSFVAGMQGGALFTDGQDNSLPAILNRQFESVGSPATFNQPTIGATLGWNLFVPQGVLTNPASPILGRLLLQYNGEDSPTPTPQAYASGEYEALPNPTYNPGFIYTGSKATLNNFGVSGIYLGQSLIPETGAWAGAGVDPRFNPFYGRLAYPGTGTSTIIGDAAAAGGSFFLFYLGLDDFFLNAAFGGVPSKPITPATGGLPSGFDGQYGAAIGSLLGSNPNLKGVVGNFPDIFAMPHFTAVTYNAIPLTSEQASDATTQLANNYNGFLDAVLAGAFGPSPISEAEAAARKLTFVGGQNAILISDETLTDLGALLVAAGFPNDLYKQTRQATSGDKFPLASGSVLGTGDLAHVGLVYGVSSPLPDQYALIPSEITAINNARAAYNATIAAVVEAYPTKLALADIEAGFAKLVTDGAAISDGLTITPNIDPPTGIYSEDGVHPNTRGYAFMANIFIDAINAKFTAVIPHANLATYSATGLPIP